MLAELPSKVNTCHLNVDGKKIGQFIKTELCPLEKEKITRTELDYLNCSSKLIGQFREKVYFQQK